jgi:hypothetical protein
MGAVLPERLEENPVLEERPVAAGTREARHSAPGPGDRAHPGERNNQKRRLLQKEIVQQVRKQKHSGNASEEKQPKERGSALQITPCCIQRGFAGHIIF